MQIELSAKPDEGLRLAIQAPLTAFNESVAGPSEFRLLALALKTDDGTVCGGLWGHTAYGWLYTQLLAVPEHARRQGFGQALMRQAEAEALRRGCRHAWVDTIFSAQGFYERLGYRAFGELPDHPAGFVRRFLAKDLLP
jgi:GNAT superfamily N-acetyltransferase